MTYRKLYHDYIEKVDYRNIEDKYVGINQFIECDYYSYGEVRKKYNNNELNLIINCESTEQIIITIDNLFELLNYRSNQVGWTTRIIIFQTFYPVFQLIFNDNRFAFDCLLNIDVPEILESLYFFINKKELTKVLISGIEFVTEIIDALSNKNITEFLFRSDKDFMAILEILSKKNSPCEVNLRCVYDKGFELRSDIFSKKYKLPRHIPCFYRFDDMLLDYIEFNKIEKLDLIKELAFEIFYKNMESICFYLKKINKLYCNVSKKTLTLKSLASDSDLTERQKSVNNIIRAKYPDIELVLFNQKEGEIKHDPLVDVITEGIFMDYDYDDVLGLSPDEDPNTEGDDDDDIVEY